MVKTLKVSEFTRPSLVIKEIPQANGSCMLSPSFWKAIEIISDEPEKMVGKYSLLYIQCKEHPSEVWRLSNAVVMLHPSKDNACVLTYSRVLRMSERAFKTEV